MPGTTETGVREAQVRLLGTLSMVDRPLERVDLSAATGRILARDLVAEMPVPCWDNSAMDGYAISTSDLHRDHALVISQRIPVGVAAAPLQPGTAARIFTGAPIPEGADAVVMQEHCSEKDGCVQIRKVPVTGANIRRAGEDIPQGTAAVPAGRRLRPVDTGLAASLGHGELLVRRKLRVAVLATGDELVPAGRPLGAGQIYSSNAPLLAGMLRELGCDPLPPVLVRDSPAATRKALELAAVAADLVLTSGGVSVGDEDHVKAAVEALGSLELWRVAMKPGKPLTFGQVRNTPFIGLPGNPVALFVSFVLFAAPAIRRMQGRAPSLPEPVMVAAGFDREVPAARNEYLRVRVRGGRMEAFSRQGAGVLSSVAWADGLACVPAGTAVAAGDSLEYFSMQALLA